MNFLVPKTAGDQHWRRRDGNRKRTFNFYPPKIVSQIDYTVCGNHLGLEIVFYGWCATQRTTKWEKSVYTPNKKCASKINVFLIVICFLIINTFSRSAPFEKIPNKVYFREFCTFWIFNHIALVAMAAAAMASGDSIYLPCQRLSSKLPVGRS